MLPPLLPCYSLDYLGWQLLDKPFLFYCVQFFLLPHKSPPFPTCRLQQFCGFLRFFASLPPSPILSSFPFPFPFPLLSSLPSPFPSAPSGVCVCVCVCVCVFFSHKPIGPQPYPVICVVANPVRGYAGQEKTSVYFSPRVLFFVFRSLWLSTVDSSALFVVSTAGLYC